jgi:hypothetical protein
MKYANLTIICIATLLGLAAFAPAAADSKAELRERFKQRLRDINDLKRDAKVGEVWDGYLDIIESEKLSRKQQDLIDDENKDRKELYRMIAKDEDTTVELVGQRDAQRRYNQAKKGDWFKLKNGRWKQKD